MSNALERAGGTKTIQFCVIAPEARHVFFFARWCDGTSLVAPMQQTEQYVWQLGIRADAPAQQFSYWIVGPSFTTPRVSFEHAAMPGAWAVQTCVESNSPPAANA